MRSCDVGERDTRLHKSVFCAPSPPRCTVVVVPNTLLYLLHKRAALI